MIAILKNEFMTMWLAFRDVVELGFLTTLCEDHELLLILQAGITSSIAQGGQLLNQVGHMKEKLPAILFLWPH